MEGIRYARSKYFLFADADDTYDLCEMPKLLKTHDRREGGLCHGHAFEG